MSRLLLPSACAMLLATGCSSTSGVDASSMVDARSADHRPDDSRADDAAADAPSDTAVNGDGGDASPDAAVDADVLFDAVDDRADVSSADDAADADAPSDAGVDVDDGADASVDIDDGADASVDVDDGADASVDAGFDTDGLLDASASPDADDHADVTFDVCPFPRLLCVDACIDPSGDRENCGGCGVACVAGAGAVGANCVAGRCGSVCDALHLDCNASADDGCEVDPMTDRGHCGGCDTVCVSGIPCRAGVCDPPPPRLVAPMSTTTSSTQRPTVRWSLAAGTDGARVQWCTDRACTSIIATLDAAGSSAMAPMALPMGAVFWRAFGMLGSHAGTTPSPTWEVMIGARDAARANAYGSARDIDGDGHADLVIQIYGGSFYPYAVAVYPGSATGVASVAAVTIPGEHDFGWMQGSAGDVNGDGFGDVVIGQHDGDARLYFGGAGGLDTTPIVLPVTSAFGATDVIGAGDVDGDGYGDVVISDAEVGPTGTIWMFRGGADGIANLSDPVVTHGPRTSEFHLAPAGDIDADGFQDLIVAEPEEEWAHVSGRVDVYYGPDFGDARRTTLVGTGTEYEFFAELVQGAIDVNGDGYCDLVVASTTPGRLLMRLPAELQQPSAIRLYLGGPTGLSTTPAWQTSIGANFTHISSADFSGDGYADLAVSRDLDYATWAPVVGALIFTGSPTGFGSAPDATHDGWDFVRSLGDVTGDGRAEVGSIGDPFRIFEGTASGPSATALQTLRPVPPAMFFGRAY